MSHRATNWAFSQAGLKPATKLVLLCLADRHNNDLGCFPHQATLARDACISRSTLNEHLAVLEARGLIHRVRRVHPVTRRQLATRYILGFEDDFPPPDARPCPEPGHGFVDEAEPFEAPAPDEDFEDPEAGEPVAEADAPCPGSGHGAPGAVSGIPPEPCPDSGQSRVRNPDTLNPGKEPGKGTSRAPAGPPDDAAFWDALLAALGLDPDDLPPFWRDWPPREHVRRWRDELGIPEPRIVEIARTSRRRHRTPPDGPKALDRLMAEEAARIARAAKRGPPEPPPKIAPPPGDLIAFYADWVNSDRYLPPSALTNRHRDELLARGLVTPERLHARGVI